MKNFGIFFRLILAIALVCVGGYQIYMAFGGNARKADTEAKEQAVYIGETVTDKDGVDFCVNSVENTQAVGDGFMQATTENNFIVLNVKITNNGKEAYDVNALRFVLLDGENEYEYSEDTIFSFENYLSTDTLNPGISREYVIAYETAFTSDSKDCQLRILSNAFSEKDSVYINLKEVHHDYLPRI